MIGSGLASEDIVLGPSSLREQSRKLRLLSQAMDHPALVILSVSIVWETTPRSLVSIETSFCFTLLLGTVCWLAPCPNSF